MEAGSSRFELRDVDRRAVMAGVLIFLAGLIIGLTVLGWWLFPVQWYDTDPQDLRRVHKETYISMVADSYQLNLDAELAGQRLVGFPQEEVQEILSSLIAQKQAQGDLPGAQRLRNLAQALEFPTTETGSATEATPAPPQTTPQLPILRSLGIGGLLFLIIFAAVGGLALVLSRWQAERRRRPPVIPVTLVTPPPRPVPEVKPSPSLAEAKPSPSPEVKVQWPFQEPGEYPLGRFITTYRLGDDGYDTSFNIETKAGEFYGACGVGFSEVLGKSPDKITAFEVWIFDRTEPQNVQTVTKVLMSEHAYQNQALRERIRGRGELVLVQPGLEITIPAVGMELVAQVAELKYGNAPGLPPNSFFEVMTTELVPRLRAGR